MSSLTILPPWKCNLKSEKTKTKTKTETKKTINKYTAFRMFWLCYLIRTGITCKKIPCYMHHSACRWFIVKKAKMF